jgi:hypothetical protein
MHAQSIECAANTPRGAHREPDEWSFFAATMGKFTPLSSSHAKR